MKVEAMNRTPYFSYQKKEEGICILRCYSRESRIVIPPEIEGIPVTELAAYAFAGEMDEEPENRGELPCICGELLEELVLPATIERVGRYAFYNCRNFSSLAFGSNIRYMGAGVFTGCKKLRYLTVRNTGVEKSCLREVLVDLNQTVIVSWQGSGNCRVLYPAFFEEAVENTPARIIETHTHGVGIQYRNAFKNTQIDWNEYDNLFEIGKHNMELWEAVCMSVYRLKSPVGLEKKAEEEYREFLYTDLKKAAEILAEHEKREELIWMAEEFARDRQELDEVMEAVSKDTELVSVLMDVSHRRFLAKKKKGFSL